MKNSNKSSKGNDVFMVTNCLRNISLRNKV